MTKLLSREELISELRKIGEAKYHSLHPFHQRMHDGRLSRDEMRNWILNRFCYQKSLPVKDALIVSKLPAREDRRLWLQRIIDHDGRSGAEGGIEKWLVLGEAAGLRRQDMLDDSRVLPGVRFAVDAYVNFCRLSPWWLAVASSLTELFAPNLVAYRIDVIEKHYKWIDSDALRYFRDRLDQAPRDSDHALDLVMREVKTGEDQNLVLDAVKFKCDVLWSMLDAIERCPTAQAVS